MTSCYSGSIGSKSNIVTRHVAEKIQIWIWESFLSLASDLCFSYFHRPDLSSSPLSPSCPCWLSSHSWRGSLTSSQKNVVNIYTWGKDNFLLLISRKVSQLPPQLWQVRDNNKFSLQSLGTGVGRVCTGFLRTTLEYFKKNFAHTKHTTRRYFDNFVDHFFKSFKKLPSNNLQRQW